MQTAGSCRPADRRTVTATATATATVVAVALADNVPVLGFGVLLALAAAPALCGVFFLRKAS